MTRKQHEENLALIREGKGVTVGASYHTTIKGYCDAHGLEIPEQDREPEPEPEVEESEPELTGFERWNLQQHVQIGEDGQVRLVFIGPWGDDDRDDDAPEIPEILAATEEEWKEISQPLVDELEQLRQQIGTLPEDAHPDEALPRGGTWLAERANWEGEVNGLRGELERVNQALETARSQALVAGPPVDLKARLMTVPNMTERRAEEIIQAFSAAPAG